MKQLVQLNYDDRELIVSGYASVEKYGRGAYTVKLTDSTLLNNQSNNPDDYIINVMVIGTSIRGKGAKKFKDSIQETVLEFERQYGELVNV